MMHFFWIYSNFIISRCKDHKKVALEVKFSDMNMWVLGIVIV